MGVTYQDADENRITFWWLYYFNSVELCFNSSFVHNAIHGRGCIMWLLTFPEQGAYS